MAKKKSLPEPEFLVASIDEVEQTYFVAQEREHGDFLDDEAILDLTGRIEEISPRHQRFVGQQIEMSFVCARRFRAVAGEPENKPFLLNISLRKDSRSFMAYLPADTFWALPAMLTSRAVTRIEARFSPVRYGSGELFSVYFAAPSKLAELSAFLSDIRSGRKAQSSGDE